MRKPDGFKNIMYIDGALNCAYDIFAATPMEFALFFPDEGQDIAFMDEIWPDGDTGYGKPIAPDIEAAFAAVWKRPVAKAKAIGIHGIIFHGDLSFKKEYYPNRRDSDAARAQ